MKTLTTFFMIFLTFQVLGQISSQLSSAFEYSLIKQSDIAQQNDLAEVKYDLGHRFALKALYQIDDRNSIELGVSYRKINETTQDYSIMVGCDVDGELIFDPYNSGYSFDNKGNYIGIPFGYQRNISRFHFGLEFEPLILLSEDHRGSLMECGKPSFIPIEFIPKSSSFLMMSKLKFGIDIPVSDALLLYLDAHSELSLNNSIQDSGGNFFSSDSKIGGIGISFGVKL